jgi:enterochelin esterase-like enzyme
MKKLILSVLTLFMLCPAILLAQGGKVFDNLSMPSKILKMDRKFAIYLPPDYETSNRSYPVLYLLHGAGDDQTGWVQFGEVKLITDKAIQEGKCTAMIIVMPDGNTGQRGYFNSPKGDWNYEDFFFQEFMPTIEKTYRIRAEKRYRAIAGLSMGGGGTFMYALHHPELFSSACPLSAYTGPLSVAELARPWEKQLEGLSDEAKQTYFEQHSATELFKNMPVDQLKSVRWYIDCGEDDFLLEGNSLLHITIHKREIPHEFRMREGVHSWTYWRESLPEVLGFVSQSFHQY